MNIEKVKIAAEDGYCVNGNSFAYPGGSVHRQVLAWIAEGNTPEPEFTDEEALARDARIEREWQKAELYRVDIEVRKVEDPLEAFNALEWRRYAVQLRAWDESANFPDSTKRPIAPDGV